MELPQMRHFADLRFADQTFFVLCGFKTSASPQIWYMLIKVDWVASCIALRVVGAVLVIFLRRWFTICTVLQPMGSKDRYLKICPKPC